MVRKKNENFFRSFFNNKKYIIIILNWTLLKKLLSTTPTTKSISDRPVWGKHFERTVKKIVTASAGAIYSKVDAEKSARNIESGVDGICLQISADIMRWRRWYLSMNQSLDESRQNISAYHETVPIHHEMARGYTNI